MEDVKVATDVVTDEKDSDESKFDAEYVKQLREEAKSYRKEKAAFKKEYEEAQARLKALEDEKLSDVEKKEAKIKELEKQITDFATQSRQKEIDNLVLKNITGKDIVDVEAAMMFIHKELAGEDEVNDVTVGNIVESVLKAKPYLVASNSIKAGAGNFAKTDNQAAQNPDSMFADFLRS